MPPLEITLADLIGPAAALVLSLTLNWLFYTGRLHGPNSVPRADYKALSDINATYPAAIGRLVVAVKKLATSVDRIRVANGKKK